MTDPPGSPPAADALPPSEPAAATDQEPEQVVTLPRPEPELPAPAVLPPVERRSIPEGAQTAGAAEALADPARVDSQPDATLVAELEEIGLSAQALAAELTLRRDLLAAELAFAQGRLTTPPEASAYTLYNRVLALDPGSPQAMSGLQSVRQELINRVLAQLAGDDLDDARRTLQAAADAGANPQLIADLRGEVDYRQRLIDAEAGRFETLYPVDQLVAVSQEPPRVSRYASTGAEESVEVQFTVTARGDVRDVAVLDAPPENLEQAVRSAVSEWRFEPVLYNGRPVPVRSSVRFTFGN